jgi:transposase
VARNGFDGLAAKAKAMINADPFSGHLFVFRGKRGDYFKGLYRDGSMTLTPAQFSLLIEAMDWRRTVAPPTPAPPMLL